MSGDHVPDCVLRLPTHRVFLLRREEGWCLSDKPSDVFALEANEYFEVELPLIKDARDQWGTTQSDKLLVKPALDLLASLSPVPGTVTFRRGHVNDSVYYLPPEVGKAIEESSPEWLPHVSIATVNTSSEPLAVDLKEPTWPSYPSPEAAASIAAAVMKNGGRLGCLRCYHPTDSCYGPLADALSAHGVCIQDGDFLYDPDLAEKRRKGRASRRRSVARAPIKEAEKAAEAKRADEEELKTITRAHLESYCAHLASTLVDGAIRNVLGLDHVEYEYSLLRIFSDAWDRVEDAYWMWESAEKDPWPATQLQLCIGSHQADTVKVLEKVVERLVAHSAKINQRAEDAGMEPKPPRYLDYAREVLRITQELVELAAKQPKTEDEEDAA